MPYSIALTSPWDDLVEAIGRIVFHMVTLNSLWVKFPKQFELGQVEAQIEFQLMIVGFHMGAQFVKGLVVLLFLEVRQFVNHDHP